MAALQTEKIYGGGFLAHPVDIPITCKSVQQWAMIPR